MKTKESVGNEGWILDEDRALKELLSNINVSDTASTRRRVGVWHGHPDQELRTQNYPYITLDLVDISEETDRAQRGLARMDPDGDYRLSSGLTYGQPVDEDASYSMDMPIPVRLTYQISTWARNPRHDRKILSALFQWGLVPFQSGSLAVSDGTLRRLDVLAFHKGDTVEQNKRLFSNSVVIGVSSEVPWSQLETIATVTNVRLRFVVDSAQGQVEVEESLIEEVS